MKKSLISIFSVIIFLFTSSLTVFAAVKTMPDGGRFDAAFYASTYPDVKAAFGNNEQLLYQHFKTNGQVESRRPYAAVKVMPDGGLFDAAFYAATYPDVAAVFGSNEALLYQHYVKNGKAEGRLPYACSGTSSPAVQVQRVELSGYLRGYITAVKRDIPGCVDVAPNLVATPDNGALFGKYVSSDVIDSIRIYAGSNYTLCGYQAGLTRNALHQQLTSSGWKNQNIGGYICYYKDTYCLYFDNIAGNSIVNPLWLVFDHSY